MPRFFNFTVQHITRMKAMQSRSGLIGLPNSRALVTTATALLLAHLTTLFPLLSAILSPHTPFAEVWHFLCEGSGTCDGRVCLGHI
jgi:hypothetical protein